MSKKRLITSGVILLLLVGLFFTRLWNYVIFDIAFGALSVVACIEVSRVAYAAGKFNATYVVCTYPAVLYLISMLFISKKYTFSYFIFAFLIVFIIYFVLIFAITVCTQKSTVDEMGKVGYAGSKLSFAFNKAMYSLALMVYPAILFLSIIFLSHFTESSLAAGVVGSDILSTFLLVLVFAVTMVCDSMAMVVGITFKGKKLCPSISPHKTISGAIGGLLGGVGAAFAVYAIFNVYPAFVTDFSAIGGNVWHILVLGLIGSLLSQIGDLVASILKRHADIKDYGNIFPGHGGVMDRLDGLVFNSTFVMIYCYAMLYLL